MDFNKLDNELLKRDTIKSARDEEVEQFINMLEEHINNKENIKEQNICVVKDRNDEKLTLVNISNGVEYDIFIVKSNAEIAKLNFRNIFDNIYITSEKSFYNIDLGTNVIFRGNSCEIYDGSVEIKNEKAKANLEELFFNLNEEEGTQYTVDKIKDDKVYLKGEDGGYFSIYKQAYPDFKQGDKIIRENRKYKKYFI